MDEFSEKLQKDGIISDLKNFIANLVLMQPKILFKNFRKQIAMYFPEKGSGGEGGLKAVWSFSKDSSILVNTGLPQSFLASSLSSLCEKSSI